MISITVDFPLPDFPTKATFSFLFIVKLILFNTSFNLAGDPIVETIEDAMEVLRKSELNYIFLPEMNHLIHSA